MPQLPLLRPLAYKAGNHQQNNEKEDSRNQTLVIAPGAGLGIWGAINLLEGYGNDNTGVNAHVR